MAPVFRRHESPRRLNPSPTTSTRDGRRGGAIAAPKESSNPMLDDDELARIGPIFWWSWRPGIKPLKALMLGGSLCLAALCIISIGLLTLLPGPSAAGN